MNLALNVLGVARVTFQHIRSGTEPDKRLMIAGQSKSLPDCKRPTYFQMANVLVQLVLHINTKLQLVPRVRQRPLSLAVAVLSRATHQ
jgi:hypothetical protein